MTTYAGRREGTRAALFYTKRGAERYLAKVQAMWPGRNIRVIGPHTSCSFRDTWHLEIETDTQPGHWTTVG